MKTRQDVVLGLVVMGFLGLLVGTILFIYPRLGGEMRTVEIQFDHEQGVAPLKPGSPVLLGGMQVGKVESVTRTTVPDEVRKGATRLVVVVYAEVEAGLVLHDDCQITTDQPPVGGGGVVAILSVGSPERPTVQRGPIRGLPAQSLQYAIGGLSRSLLGPGGLIEKLDQAVDARVDGSLMNRLVASLADINAITAQLRDQLDPHEQKTLMSKIHAVVDDLAGTTAALREQTSDQDAAALLAKVHAALDELQAGLHEANELLRENRPALRSTLDSVEHAARTVDEQIVTPLAAELKRDDPAALLGKLHASMDELRRSAENVFTITDSGRQLMVLNRPALQRVIENLKETSDQMRVGVQEILLAPWRLFAPPVADQKRLEVFEAARRFAEAATYLDDAAARLGAVAAAGPEGRAILESQEEVRALQQTLRSAFERFEKAEAYFFERLK